ncbi:DUF2127 domain-containing protein [Amnibacterium endophyticum]|uniref:DUF2127 domain-containing protein n=1 Tax=Amnibacterium endophyticum TaxID=2109337 RepID=A0ABW4LDD8_9MICO
MTATSAETGRHDRVLDVVFLVGVVLKGLDGLFELVAGVPLLFIGPQRLDALAQSFTAEELQEDPHDLVAHLVLHGAAAATSGGLLFAAVYLLVHGVVKLAVVAALIAGAHRVQPWAIGVLIAFVVFQLVEMTMHFSIGLVLITLLDLVVIVLAWREYRKRRTFREAWDSVRGRSPQRA